MINIYLDFIVSSEKENINLEPIIHLPTESSHKIGDFWHGQIKLDYSEWRYVSKIYETPNINEILFDFYNKIKEHEDELINIIEKSNAKTDIYFVIRNSSDEEINFSIDRELVKFCARINTSIRFD